MCVLRPGSMDVRFWEIVVLNRTCQNDEILHKQYAPLNLTALF